MTTKRSYWVAYLIGGHYRGGWRPSLYQHVRKYYREGWRAAGYTLTDWVLGRPTKYFRRKGPLAGYGHAPASCHECKHDD